VAQCIKTLKKHFPNIPVQTIDERYSSKRASESFLESGLKKKKRQNKALIDETSAVILLQDYLQTSGSV
jgi:putative Holliday junction resolvase